MRPRRPEKIIQNIRINIFVNHFKTVSKQITLKFNTKSFYVFMKKILILLSILALTSVTASAQYTAKGVVEDKFGPVIGAAVV